MRILVLIVAIVLTAGCSTPYQKESWLDGGFDEVQLAPNVWRVSFKGNEFTGSDTATDYAMLRSAELTLQSGYRYFAFASSRLDREKFSITTPVTTTTTFGASQESDGIFGVAKSVSTGGRTYDYYKPRANNTVVMFHDKPSDGALAFDAQTICRSLGAKYSVSCGRRPSLQN